jgi:hypothetical protein
MSAIKMDCEDCEKFRLLAGVETEDNGCPEPTAYEPPEGEGYQMWEDTSEGSPISPVFETPEELAQWLAKSDASSFGSSTATYEQWLGMIKGPAWAPSLVIDSQHGIRSGVEAASDGESE